MRIEHVTLLVKDREKALAFFKDVLDFDHELVDKHAWVIVGDQYIHITEDSGETTTDTFYHFCIEREDIDDYANKLKDRGVELIDEQPGASFFVKDLDGNLIEFSKPRNRF
ncbi:MAG: hypothetical protein COV31_01790 [Candidatus Yanofskybacteria bacterium CG10_big_fil_rev_8_21_14_0_10_46_23]|uniref:VOC domain-containing protein n=1 Tax=Candidatus Yanofskybacteria bacterium CG10_big_fil_rev_8_21_14_0_10_46_23 TaxID=1975098 RepID=A0A2H0R490_9BACT|nr:MAG: hypothetical protein COV31_01790 [Candidatus Yanofskybacteria bacterium CG10_big_fil_rev_8_21_14_0_10_46_23]